MQTCAEIHTKFEILGVRQIPWHMDNIEVIAVALVNPKGIRPPVVVQAGPSELSDRSVGGNRTEDNPHKAGQKALQAKP